jgi:hypothetical protein
LLKVTAEIPMPEVQRLLDEGRREAAARALAAAQEWQHRSHPAWRFWRIQLV